MAYLHLGPEHTMIRKSGKWMNGFMIWAMILIVNELVSKMLATKPCFFDFFYLRVAITRFWTLTTMRVIHFTKFGMVLWQIGYLTKCGMIFSGPCTGLWAAVYPIKNRPNNNLHY
jgi:hypothetical protein